MLYIDRGLATVKDGYISVYDSTFKNCYFDNGLIEVDTNNEINGNYLFENTYFYNNTSPNGSILNIKSYGIEKVENVEENNDENVDENGGKNGGENKDENGGENVDEITNKIIFKNSIFKKNFATSFGGVIYTVSTNTQKYVKFDECEFINNKAVMGDICFSLTNNNEPQFTNKEAIKEMKGFATNPTKILLSDDYNITINSGDTIPDGISCK